MNKHIVGQGTVRLMARDHQVWMESNGTDGSRADFSDCDLSNIDLNDFNFKDAIFDGALLPS